MNKDIEITKNIISAVGVATTISLMLLLVACRNGGTGSSEGSTTDAFTEISLPKCESPNPVTGITGGDPSAFCEGDKVYLYTGHDVSTDEEVSKSIYNIPEYLCYSSSDMVNWNDEGVVMTMDTVSWAEEDTSA